MGPSSNLLIQILDDSDDPITQITLIKEEVLKWQQNGAHGESQVRNKLQLHQGLRVCSNIPCRFLTLLWFQMGFYGVDEILHRLLKCPTRFLGFWILYWEMSLFIPSVFLQFLILYFLKYIIRFVLRVEMSLLIHIVPLVRVSNGMLVYEIYTILKRVSFSSWFSSGFSLLCLSPVTHLDKFVGPNCMKDNPSRLRAPI